MGRNKQVLGKERERKKMRLEKSRTKRRMEANQDQLAKDVVDRAEASELLQSRTNLMIAWRVEKKDPGLQVIMEAYQAKRSWVPDAADVEQQPSGPSGPEEDNQGT
jgi:hypothetical protein